MAANIKAITDQKKSRRVWKESIKTNTQSGLKQDAKSLLEVG